MSGFGFERPEGENEIIADAQGPVLGDHEDGVHL
jgi:hypothetical protein